MTMPITPSSTDSHSVSVQSLGSGSSGNAFVVTTGERCVLIDCGIGIRSLTSALRQRNLALDMLDTVCVTHEHSDHIRTLPKVVRDDTVIFATDGTVVRSSIHQERHVRAVRDTPQRFGNMTLWPMPVLHDAKEPCGFMLELPDNVRVTFLTDLGAWHESLTEYVRASDLIVLEANHDEEMLRTGPYPQYLKKRVASDVGHLSNRHCGAALGATLRATTHRPDIWLAHLSDHNNTPALAEGTVRDALRDCDLDLSVTALPRRSAGPVWTPKGERSGVAFAAPNPPLQQMGLKLGL